MNILDIWKDSAHFVFRVCLRYVNDIRVAEDVRQDVFLKIIGSQLVFKNQSSVKTWIYSIALNCCLDYFRKQQRLNNIEDEFLQTGGLILSDSQAPVWEVGKASKMKCPISQLLVELYFGEGWEREEIAQIFGFSSAHVSRRLHEGVFWLKRLHSSEG